MAAADPYKVVTNPQRLTADEAERVEAYWTPTRMETAEPLPLPTVYLPRRLREQLTQLAAADTGMVVTEPAPPDRLTTLPTAGGFNTRLVTDMSVYPYAVVGKLFMTFGSRNFVGSAWVIGERTVFTAGHCVHDRTQGWGNNLLFHAQFNNGASVGTWPLGTLGSLNRWIQDEDFEFDMGMGISTNPIRPVTGRAGWIANISQIQGQIKSIGYPAETIANFNFDGQRMWECDGDFINTQDGIMAMNNNMTGGCSGGPGFYPQSGQWYAIWVNSFRFTGEPNILRSPFFGQAFLNLIQWMRDNGGDV